MGLWKKGVNGVIKFGNWWFEGYFSLQGTALSFVSIRERPLMEDVENHLRGDCSEDEKVFRWVVFFLYILYIKLLC